MGFTSVLCKSSPHSFLWVSFPLVKTGMSLPWNCNTILSDHIIASLLLELSRTKQKNTHFLSLSFSAPILYFQFIYLSLSLGPCYFSSDSFHPIHPQPPLDPPTLDMLTSTHTSSTNCLSSIFCSTPHHSTNRWITFLAPELCTNISWLRERERMKNASARALGATGGFTLVPNCVTGWKNSSVASQAECRSSVSVTITASLLL